MSGSPSPSIFVCHVSSAGSRGGRLLLHARVWEEDSTPLHSLRHTWMGSVRFVSLWTWLSPRLSAEGSGPSALCVFMCVCVSCLLVWYCACVSVHVCVCVCVSVPARWHELGLCVCQCSRMWDGRQLAWSEQSKRAWQKIPQYPAFKKCRRPTHAEASKVNV